MRYTTFFALFILYLFFLPELNAQKLEESIRHSPYTYIYRISDREAKKINRRDLSVVDDSYFHMKVDSFLTGSDQIPDLEPGNYLKAVALGGDLSIEFTSILPLQPRIIDNDRDLMVRLYDDEANLIEDADIKLGFKRLRFDEATRTFRIRKSSREGILKVNYRGITGFYEIDAEYEKTQLGRIFRYISVGIPYNYIWRPIRYVVLLPIDGTKSIIRGYPQGVISRSWWFLQNSYEKVVCIFNDDYCQNRSEHSFMVFNKPKYRPGDTVRWKAYVTSKRGKPLSQELTLKLVRQNKNMGKVTPYAPGGYSGEFILNDSLNLFLDRSYGLSLKKGNYRTVITEYFFYEDYELKDVELSSSLSHDLHGSGVEQEIEIEVKDLNELRIYDSRYEVRVLSMAVGKISEDYLFVPTELWYDEGLLDNDGPSHIAIPDSIFPAADLDYEVELKVLTPDNQEKSSRMSSRWLYFNTRLSLERNKDSISVLYLKNRDSLSSKASVYSRDFFGNEKHIKDIQTPGNFEWNPYAQSYRVVVDSISEIINMDSEPSGFTIQSARTEDSLQFKVINPQKLPFSWFLYRVNKELDRGYDSELARALRVRNDDNYFLSLQYIWAGRVHKVNYKLALEKSDLNIQVNEPPQIFPGQKTKIDVIVTDINGQPVEGVDISAYAFTEKFRASAPRVPNFNDEGQNRKVINQFAINNTTVKNKLQSLDYEKWRKSTDLDTIEYYKFLYPDSGLYTYQFMHGDGNSSQLAPYVVENGIVQKVHVVYVDYLPVFFDWANIGNPYSFRLTDGYHRVELRTDQRKYVIDSVFAKSSYKTILSVSNNYEHKNVRIYELENKLSNNERWELGKYLFHFENNWPSNKLAYLEERGGRNILLDENQISFWHGDIYDFRQHAYRKRSQEKAFGPVYFNEYSFNLEDQWKVDFSNESNYRFTFKPEFQKLKSINYREVPKYFFKGEWDPKFGQLAISDDSIKKLIKFQYQRRRYLYQPFFRQKTSVADLSINLRKRENHLIISEKSWTLNYLLFKTNDIDFLKVYPGRSESLEGLDSGNYKLIILYADDSYSVADSLEVKSGGDIFLNQNSYKIIEADSFSHALAIKMKTYYASEKIQDEYFLREEIKPDILNRFSYTGNGPFLSGRVTDENGEGLPGVTILAKGTAIGTVTDINGYFSLRVPNNASELVYSFVGYAYQERPISGNNFDVTLSPDMLQLQEVVVTGYASTKRSMMTSSVQTVLQGRVAGVNVSYAAGASPEIKIRGVSTTFQGEPLIIIDGMIYSGKMEDIDPAFISDVSVLESETATALYGSRAINGVIIIEGSNGIKLPENMLEPVFSTVMPEIGSHSSNGIRSNFADHAFWKVQLRTDIWGKASFEAEFPDDITAWSTNYLAIKGDDYSGQKSGTIKSFKPIMARVDAPRFMVEGDSIVALGRINNYTGKSEEVKRSFEFNGDTIFNRTDTLNESIIDSLHLHYALGDTSIQVRYEASLKNGYSDGELRELQLERRGIKKWEGSFWVLDSDTSFSYLPIDPERKMSIHASANYYDMLEGGLNYLINYQWSCNEQLASRLIGHIYYREWQKDVKKKEDSDLRIRKLISDLLKNRNTAGLWGWWGESHSSWWVSRHVVDALKLAEKYGYKVKWGERNSITIEHLVDTMEKTTSINTLISALDLMNWQDSTFNGNRYYQKMDTLLFTDDRIRPSLSAGILEYILSSSFYTSTQKKDFLDSLQRRDIFGSMYFTNSTSDYQLFYQNDIQTTLRVYDYFSNRKSPSNDAKLKSIRTYLLTMLRDRRNYNTYQFSRILLTIFEDILSEKGSMKDQELSISGLGIINLKKENQFELGGTDSLTIKKRGQEPIFLSITSDYWEKDPILETEDFKVKSFWETSLADNILEAGKEATLKVQVDVLKSGKYGMVRIPIPSGCTYVDKSARQYGETHREYFKEAVVIYLEDLNRGQYEYNIRLLPKFTGRYTLNPASVELMYFPLFKAHEAVKKLDIK